MAKFTEDQVRHVCQLLQDHPEMTYKEVEKETGVTACSVCDIYRGYTWIQISRNYKFPKRHNYRYENIYKLGRKYSVEQATKVCELLEAVYEGKEDLVHKEIAAIVGVTVNVVNNIAESHSWAWLAKDYDWYKAKFCK